MKQVLMNLQDHHLRTVCMLQRLNKFDINKDKFADTNELFEFLRDVMTKGSLRHKVRQPHPPLLCLPPRLTHRASDALLAPKQTVVGDTVEKDPTPLSEPIHMFHTLHGTANAQPQFEQSFFSDLVLLLRWLYADEQGAKTCEDYELFDALCRYAGHASG